MATFDGFFASTPVYAVLISNGEVHVTQSSNFPPHPQLPYSRSSFPFPINVTYSSPLLYNMSDTSAPSLHPSISLPIPSTCFPGRYSIRLPRSLFIDPYQWGRNQVDPTQLSKHFSAVHVTLLGGPIDLEQPVFGPDVWPTSLLLLDWISALPSQLRVPLHVRVHPATLGGVTPITLHSSDVFLQCRTGSYYLSTSLSTPSSELVSWSIPTSYLGHQPWVPLVTQLVVWVGIFVLMTSVLFKWIGQPQSSRGRKHGLKKSK